MKTFTFEIANNNTFRNTNNTTNYSKILDKLILDSIKKNNAYLFKSPEKKCTLCNSCPFSTKKTNDSYTDAINFLLSCKKKKNIYNLPFELNKIYYINGTPICFYDDEIQIESDIYSYDDFSDLSFLDKLTPKKKKIIIDIYTKGHDIEINI